MKKVFNFLIGIGVGFMGAGMVVSSRSKKMTEIENSRDKFKNQYEMLLRWMQNNQSKKRLAEYFVFSKISKIAIYGSGTLGQLLLQEIKETSGLEVLYMIDKNAAGSVEDGLPVIGLNEISKINEADAVIITPIAYYDEIEQDLLKAGLAVSIISLEDIVYLVS